MITVNKFDSFNFRRYSNPWIALVSAKTAKIDFSVRVGGYTGAYNTGEAGELYLTDPIDGAVYAYGQKDYRGSNGFIAYVQYLDGALVPVEKIDLIAALERGNATK